MTRLRLTGKVVARRATVGGILIFFLILLGYAEGQTSGSATAAPMSLRSDPVATREAVSFLRRSDFTSVLNRGRTRNYMFVPTGTERTAKYRFLSLDDSQAFVCASATLFEDGQIKIRPFVSGRGFVKVTLRPGQTYRLLVQSTSECDGPPHFRVTITKLAPIASTACLISSRTAIRRYDALQAARAKARRNPTAANRRAVARALSAARSALHAQARACRT
ncbi:MAG: hypothetical protein U0R70_01200 [Solirubrobacteraceae bacterium]